MQTTAITQPVESGSISRIGVRRDRQLQFTLLWFAFFVSGMGWGFSMPLFPIFIVESGVTIQVYGLLQSYAAVASILTQIWIGRYSDRLGRRKPLVVGSFLTLVPIVIVFPRVQVALGFGFLLALHQITMNTNRAMNNAWVSSWATRETLGRVNGAFRAAGSLGWVVATPLLGTMLDRFGYQTSFTMTAVIYICVALFIARLIKDDEEPSRAGGRAKASSAPEDKQEDGSHATLRSPLMVLFFICLGIFYVSQGIGGNLNSIYLKQEMGVTNTQFGWLVSIQAWFEVPLMFLLGSMSDRFNTNRVLSIAFATSGIRWLLLSLVTNPFWLFPIQSLHAIGVTVGEVLAIAFVAKHLPTRALGASIGMKMVVQNASMLFAPAFAGYFAHRMGMQSTFQVAAALSFVAMFVMFVGVAGLARRARRLGIHA